MVDQWRNCAVKFPGDFREIHGCTVERDSGALRITIPGGVVEQAISAIDRLPRRRWKAFPIDASCLGGQHETFNKCTLKKHERGPSVSEIGIQLGDDEPPRPHVFTFRCK